MTDHPLAPPTLHLAHDLDGIDRRHHAVSWTWLAVVLFVVAFWTTVALLLESALSG